MLKAFLSYSSKQSGFVEMVANSLKRSNVLYDCYTFESGDSILDEIIREIGISKVFVLFISQESLTSKWVKEEILEAKNAIFAGKISFFLPLIIDPLIEHDDPKIPDWIRESYSLHNIKKPSYCAERIKQKLITAEWNFPEIKPKDTLFVGRNKQMAEFESKQGSYNDPHPVCCFIKGMPTIGRKLFLRHALIKSGIIRDSYVPRIYKMDNRKSIEDIITYLYQAGFSDFKQENVENLMSKTVEYKINLLISLIKELNSQGEILIIDEYFSLIDRDNNMVDWLLPVIKGLEDIQQIALCIVTSHGIHDKSFFNNQNLMFLVQIPELEIEERNQLFYKLSKQEKIYPSQDDADVICKNFTGFPDQVRYAISLMKIEGIQYLIDNLDCLVDFNKDKILRFIGSIDTDSKDSLYWQLLKLLSMGSTFTPYLIQNVLKEDASTIRTELIRLADASLITNVGDDQDLISLSDSAKDYIQRLPYVLNKKYTDNLAAYTKEVLSDYQSNALEREHSDYYILLKEALKNGDTIPVQYLIPSHYVNAIRELYRDPNRRALVIELADKILKSTDNLDPTLTDEIRYWLCLTLARDRNNRCLHEVELIRRDADKYFLKGFYFRKIGRSDKAIEQFKKALDCRYSFAQAERELAQAYCSIDRFDLAYNLAKKGYEENPTSEHQIQCFVKCMIHEDGEKKKDEIYHLIECLKKCHGDTAQEMYLTSLAIYYVNIEDDFDLGLKYADSAISAYPDSMYSYLTKLEILSKKSDKDMIERTLLQVDQKFKESHEIRQNYPYYAAKVLLFAMQHKTNLAEDYLQKNRKKSYPDRMIESLQKRIDFYK